jgi:addiction module HigA family antidote
MVNHPGEILMSRVLLPANLSIRQAAERLEISAESLAELICGTRSVTPAVAVALAREFGYSRAGWLALQRLWDEERRLQLIG